MTEALHKPPTIKTAPTHPAIVRIIASSSLQPPHLFGLSASESAVCSHVLTFWRPSYFGAGASSCPVGAAVVDPVALVPSARAGPVHCGPIKF
jgi:hypothetical protein